MQRYKFISDSRYIICNIFATKSNSRFSGIKQSRGATPCESCANFFMFGWLIVGQKGRPVGSCEHLLNALGNE